MFSCLLPVESCVLSGCWKQSPGQSTAGTSPPFGHSRLANEHRESLQVCSKPQPPQPPLLFKAKCVYISNSIMAAGYQRGEPLFCWRHFLDLLRVIPFHVARITCQYVGKRERERTLRIGRGRENGYSSKVMCLSPGRSCYPK